MDQKHRVKINVSNSDSPVVESRKVTMRSKALDFIFGKKMGVLVVVPGDSVESVEICEIEKGGRSYGEI